MEELRSSQSRSHALTMDDMEMLGNWFTAVVRTVLSAVLEHMIVAHALEQAPSWACLTWLLTLNLVAAHALYGSID